MEPNVLDIVGAAGPNKIQSFGANPSVNENFNIAKLLCVLLERYYMCV